MSNHPPKQRHYRVVSTGGHLWKYACQVRRLGIWWTFNRTDFLDRAEAFCRDHAQPVKWEGKLP